MDNFDDNAEPSEVRTMLMTNSEAVHSLYGEISTERDGDLTHQCIQTNLADVICGGKWSLESSLKVLIFLNTVFVLYFSIQAIQMTKSYMLDHQNVEVLHFQLRVVLKGAIV